MIGIERDILTPNREYHVGQSVVLRSHARLLIRGRVLKLVSNDQVMVAWPTADRLMDVAEILPAENVVGGGRLDVAFPPESREASDKSSESDSCDFGEEMLPEDAERREATPVLEALRGLKAKTGKALSGLGAKAKKYFNFQGSQTNGPSQANDIATAAKVMKATRSQLDDWHKRGVLDLTGPNTQKALKKRAFYVGNPSEAGGTGGTGSPTRPIMPSGKEVAKSFIGGSPIGDGGNDPYALPDWVTPETEAYVKAAFERGDLKKRPPQGDGAPTPPKGPPMDPQIKSLGGKGSPPGTKENAPSPKTSPKKPAEAFVHPLERPEILEKLKELGYTPEDIKRVRDFAGIKSEGAKAPTKGGSRFQNSVPGAEDLLKGNKPAPTPRPTKPRGESLDVRNYSEAGGFNKMSVDIPEWKPGNVEGTELESVAKNPNMTYEDETKSRGYVPKEQRDRIKAAQEAKAAAQRKRDLNMLTSDYTTPSENPIIPTQKPKSRFTDDDDFLVPKPAATKPVATKPSETTYPDPNAGNKPNKGGRPRKASRFASSGEVSSSKKVILPGDKEYPSQERRDARYDSAYIDRYGYPEDPSSMEPAKGDPIKRPFSPDSK